MKIKRRSVISFALIAAMIFSVGAFMSCTSSEAEQSITIEIKLQGSSELYYGGPALIKSIASEMTVLTATRQLCENLDIVFVYDPDIGAIKKIGTDVSELFQHEFETQPPEDEEEQQPADDGEEGEETEEETEAEDVVKDYYYDWVCSVNGSEAKLSDLVKAGDNVVWEWKEVKKELAD